MLSVYRKERSAHIVYQRIQAKRKMRDSRQETNTERSNVSMHGSPEQDAGIKDSTGLWQGGWARCPSRAANVHL